MKTNIAGRGSSKLGYRPVLFRNLLYIAVPDTSQISTGNENMRGLADAVRGKVAPFAGRFA